MGFIIYLNLLITFFIIIVGIYISAVLGIYYFSFLDWFWRHTNKFIKIFIFIPLSIVLLYGVLIILTYFASFIYICISFFAK
jgi:hypothetical protein